jgi:hypothetical protein
MHANKMRITIMTSNCKQSKQEGACVKQSATEQQKKHGMAWVAWVMVEMILDCSRGI